jgi:hypothetical protein
MIAIHPAAYGSFGSPYAAGKSFLREHEGVRQRLLLVFALPRLARRRRPGAASRSIARKIITAENGGRSHSMLDFNISIFPGAAGAVADASVLAEVSATPASAETVLARSLSALLEAGSAVKPPRTISPGVGHLPVSPGQGRRRPLHPPLGRGAAPPPQSARHPAAQGEEHGDPP